jgi:CHAT domain-containing protein
LYRARLPGRRRWPCTSKPCAPVSKLPGNTARDQAWTKDDDELIRRLRKALGQRSAGWADLANRVRQQRLDPLKPHLAAVGDLPAARRLIVIPAASLVAGVPMQALTEQYAVTYAPSGTVLARLTESHRPLGDPSLLALGDPTFTSPAPPPPPLPDHGLFVTVVLPGGNAARTGIRAGDVLLTYGGIRLTSAADLKVRDNGDLVPAEVWREGSTLPLRLAPGKLGVVIDKEAAPVALRRQREFDALMVATRGPAPKALPGTRREVQALAGLFPAEKTLVLLGSQASEQRLDELSDRLKDFRILHFATHGHVHEGDASHSALLLARDQLPDPLKQSRKGAKVYDGRLKVRTVAHWRLDADLAVLSACETGLGKDGHGEGLLGFAHVLFKARARSVVVSLWQVDDEATALLMTRFYENLLGKRDGLKAPLPRAAAHREAQRWLRELPRSQAAALTAKLSGGELRGTVSALRPQVAPAASEERPYAHPYLRTDS